jgi:hypothetical protein
MSDVIRPDGHDAEYFTRRESQARLAAERSADPAARKAHETLADSYAERLRDDGGAI